MENLKTKYLKIFVLRMVSPKTSHLRGLLTKTVSFKGKIAHNNIQHTTRTMLLDQNLPNQFWEEVISAACHILNKCLIRPILKNTPMNFGEEKNQTSIFFHPLGCKYFIHNNGKNNVKKFDPRSDKGIFLGYAPLSKAFQVYNERTLSVEDLFSCI